MLFKLSDTLIEENNFKTNKTKILRAVKYILQSVWECKHLVLAEPEVISFFMKEIKDEDCLSVLQYLKRNYYSFINYENIKFFILVMPEHNLMNKKKLDDFVIIELSVDYFQNSNLTRETKILCENAGDAFFFEKIAKYFYKNSEISNINLCFEEENGGGSYTSVLYQKYIDNKNIFCLCLCDNDKKYPEDTIKDTLLKVKNCINEHFLCDYIGLEAHEIENLIPFNYFEKLRNTHHIPTKGIDFILNIKSSQDSESLKFLDIKKGILYKHIKNNSHYLNFAKKLNSYNTIENIDLELNQISDNAQIIPNCGKVLKEIMLIDDIFNIEPELLEFQKTEWQKIGRYFTFWTCAKNNEAIH